MIDLKFYCPAVSQIWSLMIFLPILMVLAANSTPIVTSWFVFIFCSMNWSTEHDLPTPFYENNCTGVSNDNKFEQVMKWWRRNVHDFFFWNGYFKLLSSNLLSGWLLFQRTLIIIAGNVVTFIWNEAFDAENDF